MSALLPYIRHCKSLKQIQRHACKVRFVLMLCSSYLTQADYSSWFMSDLDPYDQYEVSVPLEIAGTCLTEVRCDHPCTSAHACAVPARPFVSALSCQLPE